MEKGIDKSAERALEAYPKETRDIREIVTDIGHPQYMRDLYIEGYHQAEKDNELTWEDIREIIDISFEEAMGLQRKPNIYKEQYYQEILKRFKDFKERKEK